MMIRAEQPADTSGIRELLESAFPTPAEAGLVDQLRTDGDVEISLVAVEADTVVGHVLFSPMTGGPRALGLGPLAVAPSQQRQGVGSLLIRQGLKQAQADGWEMVFVLGDPAFYRRFGFDPGLASGFISPYAGPYLMALVLSPDLPPLEGKIDYAPAFAALG